ncbi:class I ribonucleotide reductase maintenance protein YfaE [Testudinibacter sp. P27/CKL/0425]
MKIHRISLPNQQRIVEHDNRTSLLETLEKHGIFHEYQCRSGYCGSCRVKLCQGKVSYPELPLAFLQPDEILLCCCKVESDLEIEF